MRELPEHQVPATFAVFFGQELRRYRTAAGLSQDQLGVEVNYTGTYVGLIEAAKRSCPRDLAERADELLDARGALLNLWAQANQEPHPAWFQPFVKAESEAASISEFEPLVVSGLLQTEEYATEVIRAGRPEATDEDPLTAVVEAAKRPRITVQVLPFSAGAHAALGGSLIMLERKHRTAYCEGHATARLISDPDEVADCAHAFSLLQSAALSVRDSVDLIRDVMEGYGS